MGDGDLLDVIGYVYDAAQDPSLWRIVLEQYAKLLAAAATMLQVHDFAQHQSRVMIGFGLTDRVKAEYHTYYSRLNLWREYGQRLYQQGRVVLDDEICPRPVIERSEFYNDCLKPAGAAYSLAAIVARTDRTALTMTALRHSHQSQWNASDAQRAALVLPHLIRAQTISTRINLLSRCASTVDDLLYGVVFVDGARHVVYANKPALEVMTTSGALTTRAGVLTANDPAADAEIRRTIAQYTSPTPPSDCPAVIGVRQPFSGEVYHLITAPITSAPNMFIGVPAPHAVVLILDPHRRFRPAVRFLTEMYGLTPREAELACRLCSGAALDRVAADLGITYETARSHLRRIFDKTQTSRQTELVLLMAGVPAGRE